MSNVPRVSEQGLHSAARLWGRGPWPGARRAYSQLTAVEPKAPGPRACSGPPRSAAALLGAGRTDSPGPHFWGSRGLSPSTCQEAQGAGTAGPRPLKGFLLEAQRSPCPAGPHLWE